MVANQEEEFRDIGSHIVARLEDIGRARERIEEILDDDLFDNLCKHDPFWSDSVEIPPDRFDILRIKISCIKDRLWDVLEILEHQE